ncbi:hypothetical protein [Actinokineospora fastidiosa]|uniref:Uncharacterized protein n=1 Tax=Actinokineospora fastidiosa TaxID=1816 RepID=A0A918GLL9_9PSEU|nr:hypothetical protein [Actinokineospora fastidiosa]GGS46676.1 hypothetical protein GCM10010171_47360 [Actinokineospora fastidiosa]
MTAPQRVSARSRIAGIWYFWVALGTVGMFAVVPFAHAAQRLRRRSAWVWVGVYGVVDIALFAMTSLFKDLEDKAPLGFIMITVAVTACFQLRTLRREVYGLPPGPGEPAPAPIDPAVAQVLAARRRREEARALADQDPLMARELGIGRPDLGLAYDDGGLVDLGSAPADTIARVLGLTGPEADRVVAAQGRFAGVDEMLVLVDLPIGAWDRIRDRGVVVRA